MHPAVNIVVVVVAVALGIAIAPVINPPEQATQPQAQPAVEQERPAPPPPPAATPEKNAAADDATGLKLPACVTQAAEDYSLPVRGLLAVWLTEGGVPGTISQNTNGTADYGPMQINTIWAKKLEKDFGITREMLTDDFCMSIRAGAYILRYEINQAGGSFWDGVGHYHSRTPHHKNRYIDTVYRNSQRF